MSAEKKRWKDLKRVRTLSAIALMTPLTLCAGTMGNGDAGCLTYGVERQAMPRPLPLSPLGEWVADTDTAMTGACT